MSLVASWLCLQCRFAPTTMTSRRLMQQATDCPQACTSTTPRREPRAEGCRHTSFSWCRYVWRHGAMSVSKHSQPVRWGEFVEMLRALYLELGMAAPHPRMTAARSSNIGPATSAPHPVPILRLSCSWQTAAIATCTLLIV